MKPAETTGARIKRLRKDRGWTQDDLAIRALLQRQTISRVELDVTLRGVTLWCIASALGVSCSHLLGGPPAVLVDGVEPLDRLMAKLGEPDEPSFSWRAARALIHGAPALEGHPDIAAVLLSHVDLMIGIANEREQRSGGVQ